MPVESPKPALTSIITPPPRLKSPSKQTKASKDVGPVQFGQEERRFVTQLTEGQTGEDISTPRQLEDIELQEKDSSIFLTEANIRELDAIDEEEFGSLLDSPSRDAYEELDEVEYKSRETRGSNVSSISEEVPDEEYDTDLEVEDPEHWLHPELFDRDTTGINRYIRICESLNIQPVTYFCKHLQDTELIMKYHGLGPLGMKAMSDPLEINTTIEKMDLEGNYILGVGATCLAKVLKDNVYVTELILSENRMGNDGARAVCDLLSENKTITYVDLKGNNIEDGVAENFYDMLTSNSDLKTLILRHNSFEDDGAKWLRDAMSENYTLETLDLSWNHFQWRGCCTIAEGIQENVGLKQLNVCMNGFGLEGAKALEEALRQNHTLLELNISYCRIPVEGAPHIAAGLENNDHLTHLDIGYNPIQGEGGLAILVATENNEYECMKHLDFGNLMVKKDFKKLAEKLEEEQSMTILFGGVLLDVTRLRNANYDPWAAHVNDPMTKLKAWLDKAGYRLVDLLLTFDRDNSLTLDLEELKQGIKGANIDLSDAEIEILMKNLDEDNSGTIEMREEGKDQESIQSSTTPDPGNQWKWTNSLENITYRRVKKSALSQELLHGDEKNELEAKTAEKFKEEQDRIDVEMAQLSTSVVTQI